MDEPQFVAGRWRIGEFIYVEYLRGDSVFVDIGPFQQDPTDEETDRAYAYLENAKLGYLELGELEWALDLDKLGASISQLRSEGLAGKLVHPPAFEAVGLPASTRYYSRAGASDGCCFLRIAFEFTDRKEEASPPHWQPPKIIS